MNRIFISYSHADEKYRTELEKHLSMLKRQGVISVWNDRRITAGQEFGGEIDSNLSSADVILLLVSSDFLASNYCYDIEMKKALERHQRKEATVIPVILRACDWHNTPFGKLLATPKDGKPVAQHTDFDSAFLEIVQAVRAALPPKKTKLQEYGITDTGSAPIVSNIRSSNLYIRKEFTDKDKNDFLTKAYEYMAKFFENSLQELEQRNPGISQTYRRIDANRFTAVIYKYGKETNRCKIWLKGHGVFENGIIYSEGSTADAENSYNETLVVKDDGSILYLHPSMGFPGTSIGDKLTFEGAAEYYWEKFIKSLQ